MEKGGIMIAFCERCMLMWHVQGQEMTGDEKKNRSWWAVVGWRGGGRRRS